MSKSKDPFKAFKDKAASLGRKKNMRTAASFTVNRNIGDRIKAKKDSRARRRAEQKAKLPKNPVKRFFYYFHPKHFAEYWFNRDGLFRFLKIVGITFAVFMVMILAVFAYFRKDLPKNITDLKTCSQGASTTYYDRTGQTLLWSSSGDVECTPVKWDNISPYLRNSVIAAEDKNFYKHGGFSMDGIIRAAISNAKGDSVQGGSTITQQFVKNSLLTQDRNITRKMKELILSIELERSYTKDEILNAYLNEISFGSRYAGAEAAAKGYFNKSAKDLTLDEAVTLAAVIPAPTYYSPYGKNTEELMARRNYILDLMVQQGYIKKDEAEAAKQVETLNKVVASKSKYKDIIAPYFVTEVQEQLEQEYGPTNARKAGFKVTTTLDLNLQKIAEQTVATAIPKLERIGGNNAAAVAEDVETGQVLAMVGGRDFNYPKFGEINYATTPRSPGSSFKPYDYASLMVQNKSWGAGSTLYDIRTDFGYGYRPQDYDLREPGPLSMRNSLGGSRNIPAIKAMYMAGIQNTHDLAKKLGLKSGITSCKELNKEDCGDILSTAIGDGGQIKLSEHVHAFSAFSRMGKVKPQAYILKVEDKNGKLVKEWKDTGGEQVLDAQIAYTINDMLSDPRASYFGSSNRLRDFRSAMKTGTTNNRENGWIMGYTPYLVFGMWSGHHENNSMSTFTESILGPAWYQFMNEAHKGKEKKDWTKPNTMKTVCINQTTGYATTSGGKCDIFPSWYTPRYPNNSQKATIDTVSGKLATECTPEAAKQTITGGGIASELPTSDPMYNNWIKPVQARIGSAGGAIPTDKDDIHTCDPADKPTISLSEPTKNGDGTYSITATATKGKYPLKSLSFSIDGSTLPGGSYDITETGSITYKYTPSATETKTINVQVVDSVLYDASDSKSFSFEVSIRNSNQSVASNINNSGNSLANNLRTKPKKNN